MRLLTWVPRKIIGLMLDLTLGPAEPMTRLSTTPAVKDG